MQTKQNMHKSMLMIPLIGIVVLLIGAAYYFGLGNKTAGAAHLLGVYAFVYMFIIFKRKLPKRKLKDKQ